MHAHVRLAAWHRERQREQALLSGRSAAASSPSPLCAQSVIFQLARTDASARAFLKAELRAALKRCEASGNADDVFSAASLSELLGNAPKAYSLYSRALAASGPCGAASSDCRAGLARTALQQRYSLAPGPGMLSPSCPADSTVDRGQSQLALAVDRRSAATLSVEEFVRSYALKRRPVIITGCQPTLFGITPPAHLPGSTANAAHTSTCAHESAHSATQSFEEALECVTATIGELAVPLRKNCGPGSSEWARMENVGTARVSEFVAALLAPTGTAEERKNGVQCAPEGCARDRQAARAPTDGPRESDSDSCSQTKREERYLFDWSLPQHCVSVLEGSEGGGSPFTVPKYFASDYLQRLPHGAMYKDSWPSLFVGPQGTTSGLHVDAFGSHFWMALLHGRKRWIFFPPEDIPYLYPQFTPFSFDPVFQVDPLREDTQKVLEEFPRFASARPFECVLNPGEFLFVPSGCPHTVENLDNTIALSANFIDETNFDSAVEALSRDAIVDCRAAELVAHFTNRFPRGMDLNQRDLVWQEFKTPGPPPSDSFKVEGHNKSTCASAVVLDEVDNPPAKFSRRC